MASVAHSPLLWMRCGGSILNLLGELVGGARIPTGKTRELGPDLRKKIRIICRYNPLEVAADISEIVPAIDDRGADFEPIGGTPDGGKAQVFCSYQVLQQDLPRLVAGSGPFNFLGSRHTTEKAIRFHSERGCESSLVVSWRNSLGNQERAQ